MVTRIREQKLEETYSMPFRETLKVGLSVNVGFNE
jgi:hypothetical protein